MSRRENRSTRAGRASQGGPVEESSAVPHTDKPGRGPLNTPDDETPTSDPIIKYLQVLWGDEDNDI